MSEEEVTRTYFYEGVHKQDIDRFCAQMHALKIPTNVSVTITVTEAVAERIVKLGHPLGS